MNRLSQSTFEPAAWSLHSRPNDASNHSTPGGLARRPFSVHTHFTRQTNDLTKLPTSHPYNAVVNHVFRTANHRKPNQRSQIPWPRHPEGKLASSHNRIVHGLLSESIIIEGEVGDRFTQLHDALIAELQPETSTEYIMVENLAVSRWRIMRLWVLENAAVSHEIRKQAGSHDGESKPTRAALAYRTLSDSTHWLDLFNRYEARFDRQFSRSLQLFYAQRARRKKGLPVPEEQDWMPGAEPEALPQIEPSGVEKK